MCVLTLKMIAEEAEEGIIKRVLRLFLVVDKIIAVLILDDREDVCNVFLYFPNFLITSHFSHIL